jgi:hypothetical protein
LTRKNMVRGKGQKPKKTREFRRRILAVLIVLIILMLLMILRPSVIRKKHLKVYDAAIGSLFVKDFCTAMFS